MNEKAKKLDYINKYLKEYFDDWLINDILLMQKKELKFTLPYILLVSAGIDFLGGLTDGFKRDNSKARSIKFIKVWMGKVNPSYELDGMGELLYNNVRCGASHQAIYKRNIACSCNPCVYPLDKHLYLDYGFGYEDRVIIQVFQFIEDFIKAQGFYKKEYINKHVESVYENLKDMLNEENKHTENVIKNLKNKNLTFNDIGKIIIKGTSKGPSEAPPDSW